MIFAAPPPLNGQYRRGENRPAAPKDVLCARLPCRVTGVPLSLPRRLLQLSKFRFVFFDVRCFQLASHVGARIPARDILLDFYKKHSWVDESPQPDEMAVGD